MTPVPAAALVIGLGGNVGTEPEIVARFRAVRAAFAAMAPTVASPVYRTSPVGPAQATFLNAALATQLRGDGEGLAPTELMTFVHALEAQLGRDRSAELDDGPRPIDVDVLLWGPRQGAWPGPPALLVPHPRLHQRRFVLAPLIDLLGEDVEVPGAGQTAMGCWDALRGTGQVVERTRHSLDDAAPILH